MSKMDDMATTNEELQNVFAIEDASSWLTNTCSLTYANSNTEIKYDGKTYKTLINECNKKAILLLPSVLLSPLPVAVSYDDIDMICAENERVRREINSYFNLKGKRKLSKVEIHYLLKNSSSFRSALMSAYKSAPVLAYDFEKDPIGEYMWYNEAKHYTTQLPLDLELSQSESIHDVEKIVLKICNNFKLLIENNGLSSLLYDSNKEPKHERAAQLLFFGIADSYCSANNIDLSREIDNGRGSVDFKLSEGAIEKVLVETKLTSNSQLKHGFTTQLPIYMSQEKTKKAIYLIIDNGHPKVLESFTKFYNEQSKEIRTKIIFYKINGVPQKSASIA